MTATPAAVTDLTIDIGDKTVPAVFIEPAVTSALLVFAHGAGAGMHHPFMHAVATRLGDAGLATLRFQFSYMHEGRRRPDPPAALLSAVRAAVDTARARVDTALPVFAGGKSMGGRMAAYAQSAAPMDGVRGLVFFGFPLHPAGRPGVERAKPLETIDIPMLFLQGTRDKLADLDLVTGVVGGLRDLGASLHVIEGADHGFHVLKRSGRRDDEVLDELAGTTVSWVRALETRRCDGGPGV